MSRSESLGTFGASCASDFAPLPSEIGVFDTATGGCSNPTGPIKQNLQNKRLTKSKPTDKLHNSEKRKKLGMDDSKFHDLRKTFGSVLAQNGVSTTIIQKLLEHSSSDLTNKVHMNVDTVLRQAIDTIPADDWLH